jgi:hypothetical protein
MQRVYFDDIRPTAKDLRGFDNQQVLVHKYMVSLGQNMVNLGHYPENLTNTHPLAP